MNQTEQEQTPKFKFGFTQSVSSGIIAFHGEVNTDDIEDVKELSKVLSLMEANFKHKGYLVASDIEPKESTTKANKNNGGK